ncbi:MAG: hypothetical protein IJS39_15840 [Synergistaceae bacterium]|nr:hypothetical protein [Synergistaceae bacterium]
MLNILDEIADYTRERVRLAKASKPLEALKAEAVSSRDDKPFRFEGALLKPKGLAFICECKKHRPQKA